jgi:hypothetical protein
MPSALALNFGVSTHDSRRRKERMLFREKVAAAGVIIVNELTLSNQGFNLILG